MELKKKILGGAGAAALGLGTFVWHNGGEKVAEEAVQTHVAPVMREKLGLPEKQEDAFKQASEQCHEQTAQNPQIDLGDSAAVYDAMLRCLIVDKNQGAALDKMAETDKDLQQDLAEIRAKLSSNP